MSTNFRMFLIASGITLSLAIVGLALLIAATAGGGQHEPRPHGEPAPHGEPTPHGWPAAAQPSAPAPPSSRTPVLAGTPVLAVRPEDAPCNGRSAYFYPELFFQSDSFKCQG
jgi:hypothetical protein